MSGLPAQGFDAGLLLLDRQLLDSDGRRCGKVDDLAFEGEPGEPLRLVALVSGPEAWRHSGRGGLGWLAARLFRGDRTIHIPVDAIDEVGSAITLNRTAADLGLAHGEELAAQVVRRIPGS
jgi:sporulation protein YlmC with PRC-barrel domain